MANKAKIEFIFNQVPQTANEIRFELQESSTNSVVDVGLESGIFSELSKLFPYVDLELASDAVVGSADLSLVSASGVTVGDYISIRSSSNHYQSNVTSIAGNIVTMAHALDYAFPAGSLSTLVLRSGLNEYAVFGPGTQSTDTTAQAQSDKRATTESFAWAIEADYAPFLSYFGGDEIYLFYDAATYTVTIEALKYDRKFVLINNGDLITSDITITDEVSPEISILSFNAEAPDANECTDQKVSIAVEGAEYPVTINYTYGTADYIKTVSEEADLFVVVKRQDPGLITLTNDSGGTDSGTPSSIEYYGIGSVDITPTSIGADVTIQKVTAQAGGTSLTTTYSIDGTTYTSNPTFTGVSPGTYTAYIKDAFGCVNDTQEFTVEELFTITGTTSEASSTEVCDKQRVNIQVANETLPITIDYSYAGISQTKTASTLSELFVEVERYQPAAITLTDSIGTVDTVTPANIKRYYVFSVDVVGTSVGGDVTINAGELNSGTDLTLSYSIDGTSYVSANNTFTGVTPGTYTAYIKDSYGCISQEEFTVDVPPYEPTIDKTRKFKERMRDSHLILDLEYDNTSGNKFYTPYVKVTYRPSIR